MDLKTSNDGKEPIVTQKMIDKLRRGVKLKSKSNIVSNLVGKNLKDEIANKKSGNNQPTKTKPISPIKKHSKPNLTVKNPDELKGNASEGMHDLLKIAMQNGSGLGMTNKLKSRLARRKKNG